ncbi:MAG: aldo/keto reductase [Thermoclostridium sp.]|nr:aldo/keto reductase [Thermoclostridium sp.]
MNISKSRTLGRSGIKISPMGLGCWAIGGAFTYNGMSDGYGQIDDEVSIKAIHRAVDLGITFFDTSDAYGTGHSERVLGKALEGIRDKVVIATKFGHTYDESTRELIGENSSTEYIMKACEASLRRLKTDYIDLYQLHRWSIPAEEIDQVIECLDKLVDKGFIRAYGWSTDWVEGASKFAGRSNCTSIQQSFNLFGYEKGILDLCEKYNLASISRSPLAMGLLSGKFNSASKLPLDDVRGNAHSWNSYFQDGKPNPEFLQKLDAVKEILKSSGRTLVQGALAWIWAESTKTIPIPGFKTVQQVEENVKAMEFGPLSDGQMKEIDRLLHS